MPIIVPAAPSIIPPPTPGPLGKTAISPIYPTYAYTTPYLTVAEFIAAPTALDITDLVPGGTQAQQTQALADSISRASSWIDDLCEQILAATLDFDRGRYRINRDGQIRMPLRYKPLLEVRSISVGTRPSAMTALTDLSDVAVMAHGTIEIPILGGYGNSASLPRSLRVGDRPLVDVSYVNGWPNTLTAINTVAGSTTLTLNNVAGVYPGTPLIISDGASTENITVSPTYTPGALTVTLAAPLTYQHSVGVSVGNLPARVKMACILLTSALIQTRGNDAIVLDQMGSPTSTSAGAGAEAESIALAIDMLSNLKRVW